MYYCKHCKQELLVSNFTLGNGGKIPQYKHRGGYFYCHYEHIKPGYPPARCHICKTTTDDHSSFCSAGGWPKYMPTPCDPLELLAHASE